MNSQEAAFRKYNVNGTNIQWTHEKLANGIVSKFGEIYIGSTYNVTSRCNSTMSLPDFNTREFKYP
ncbi:MAG: hypothetical protein IPI23_16650 [Bacteroidetes bacterium]|nr:hypothetical protein [Bacteroidota bacterium]